MRKSPLVAAFDSSVDYFKQCTLDTNLNDFLSTYYSRLALDSHAYMGILQPNGNMKNVKINAKNFNQFMQNTPLNANVYLTPCTFIGDRSSANIDYVFALCLDLDPIGKDGFSEFEQRCICRSAIHRHHCTAIVSSGRGLQLW